MRIQPLGPQGVRQRIAEIQSRIAALDGSTERLGASTAAVSPTPIKGKIGNSLGPLDPFGPEASVSVPAPSKEILGLIQQAADNAGVDRDLFESLISVESGFNPDAQSLAGAKGLAQLMPSTAASLGVTDPFDPQQNLNAGAKYLAQLLSRFGSADLALAAYNAGPGAVERYKGIPPFRETQNYVQKVLGRYQAKVRS